MSNLAELHIGNSQKMKNINDNSIDFIFTGPPYWTHLEYSQDKSQLGNINDYKTFHEEVAKVWAECFRVLKPGSFLCIHANNLYEHDGEAIIKRIPLAEDFTHHIMLKGFIPSNTIFWDSYMKSKNKRLPQEQRIKSRSQFIVPQRMQYFLFFLKRGSNGFKQKKYNNIQTQYYWQPFWKTMTEKKLLGSILLYRLASIIVSYLPFEDIMSIPFFNMIRKAIIGDNKTEKNFPASMDRNIVMKILKDFTDEGDSILDPFAGSGTTLAVASSLNRKSIGYEISSEAAKIISHQLNDNVDILRD